MMLSFILVPRQTRGGGIGPQPLDQIPDLDAMLAETAMFRWVLAPLVEVAKKGWTKHKASQHEDFGKNYKRVLGHHADFCDNEEKCKRILGHHGGTYDGEKKASAHSATPEAPTTAKKCKCVLGHHGDAYDG